MGNKFWKGISAFAAVVAGVGAAGAADLAVKEPVYKAPPVILSDWSGFYIGINGGYGWGDIKFDNLSFDNLSRFNTKPKGGLFGGHVGYNWQYGKVVTGLEVDFDGADLKSADIHFNCQFCVNISQTAKFDALATARARLGYALLPDLLAYGTAGFALGHSTLNFTDFVGNFSFLSQDTNANHFGWAAGAGLEYYLGHGFIVRGEYLHYDFMKNPYTVFNSFGSAATTIDVARGGLSYKF